MLSGFMATGKSTVGRSVAQRLRRPFVDLDRLIEDRAGCSISELFRTRGEPAFRALERQALLDVLRDDAVVLSVGGGALLDRGMRLDVLERARVVTLRASAAEAVRRAATDTARPLLGATADVHALLELRASSYAECHASVDTEGRDVAAVVADVCSHVEVSLVAVACGRDSYSVQVGAGVTAGALARRDAPGAHLLVTDSNVGALYADQVAEWLGSAAPVHRVVLTPGEEHKSLDGMRSLWAAAAGFGLDRRCQVFSLGGGVVSDMAGFFAASWLRGVGWGLAPTSFLAMVDASVGGKTGVDFLDMKNAVGAFWQPRFVVCDTAFLATEPLRGFRSAVSEVVKTALIGDAALFDLLETRQPELLARDPALLAEVVERCVTVKARVVSRDPREAGLRAVLNLGHTVGHALEACTEFREFTHGEAVSLGLMVALRLGEQLGHTPAALVTRVHALLTSLELPTQVAPELLSASLALLHRDKKRHGAKIRFVFAHDVGEVTTADLPMETLQAALGAPRT